MNLLNSLVLTFITMVAPVDHGASTLCDIGSPGHLPNVPYACTGGDIICFDGCETAVAGYWGRRVTELRDQACQAGEEEDQAYQDDLQEIEDIFAPQLKACGSDQGCRSKVFAQWSYWIGVAYEQHRQIVSDLLQDYEEQLEELQQGALAALRHCCIDCGGRWRTAGGW